MENKIYLAIDLKSFYASVECIERGLDPLKTNLVVADNSRTEKTICLAVSPSLKSYGIKGRPRLFEVIQKVREVNASRLNRLKTRKFSGKSYDYEELNSQLDLALDYIVAIPRMAYYIDYSAKIYNIYLKYIAAEDIHVYSIDEVFIDLTCYLKTYGLGPKELTEVILKDILYTTGITATAGLGTNLYLAKVAMDILAKKMPLEDNYMQIAYLDEMSYRKLLWSHRPITDFWRVGSGYAKRLEKQGLYTMGDIAKCSLGTESDYLNEDLLYKIFGVNAELLIDHAWGWEPCTIEDIKRYKPASKSLGSGQVLQSPHNFHKARLIVWEMADLLALDLVAKAYKTTQIVLRISYDRESLLDPKIKQGYKGEIIKDAYGRYKPKSVQATKNFPTYTSSSKEIIEGTMELYEEIADKNLLIRKLNISANKLLREDSIEKEEGPSQLDFFTNYDEEKLDQVKKEEFLNKERKVQETILSIKDKYGRNAILKGVNLVEGATTLDRNKQIGGHKA
ncbi:DNA methylase [Tissierella pigra]|uniref:DNA methylase n=1 Tax=Tissierella pigra TaxID=2607614 RepID=A0A6N7XZT3_9FIRM|nr:DNA methylase [Tissierella pigra]MSU02114.1 DNA methylase [Tissierella pigra]